MSAELQQPIWKLRAPTRIPSAIIGRSNLCDAGAAHEVVGDHLADLAGNHHAVVVLVAGHAHGAPAHNQARESVPRLRMDCGVFLACFQGAD